MGTFLFNIRPVRAVTCILAAVLPLAAGATGCERESAVIALPPSPPHGGIVRIVDVESGVEQDGILTVHLGQIVMGQFTEHKFNLTNTSGMKLRLGGNASCDCTVVRFDTPVADPGQTVGFGVIYNSQAKPDNIGRIRQPFLLTLAPVGLDDEDVHLVNGIAECVVEPSIDFHPRELRFEVPSDSSSVSVSKPTTVTITNHRDVPVDVTIVETDGGENDIPDGAQVFSVPSETVRIAPGSDERVSIGISPSYDKNLNLAAYRVLRISTREGTAGEADETPLDFYLPATISPVRSFVPVPGTFRASARNLRSADESAATTRLGDVKVTSWQTGNPVRIVDASASSDRLSLERPDGHTVRILFDLASHTGGIQDFVVTLHVESGDGGETVPVKIPVLILP